MVIWETLPKHKQRMEFLDEFFEDQNTLFSHQIDFRYKSFHIPEGFEEEENEDGGSCKWNLERMQRTGKRKP
jgi:hypothetical protein